MEPPLLDYPTPPNVVRELTINRDGDVTSLIIPPTPVWNLVAILLVELSIAVTLGVALTYFLTYGLFLWILMVGASFVLAMGKFFMAMRMARKPALLSLSPRGVNLYEPSELPIASRWFPTDGIAEIRLRTGITITFARRVRIALRTVHGEGGQIFFLRATLASSLRFATFSTITASI